MSNSPVRRSLSIVTTLYNSAATIEEFCRRSAAAAEALALSFEIVIVDDGSPDNSLAIATRIAAVDGRVKVVELSRNFGHHKALMTGLMHARGDYCLLIDSDLEEAPELLASFWQQLASSGADVVYGFQARRAGSIFRRLSGAIAFRMFQALIPQKIPRNLITLRLMKRDYVDALLLHREHHTILGGLWVITGFHQLGVAVDKKTRDTPAYGFGHRWHTLIDSISSFSEAPLVGIFYLGTAIVVLAVIVATWLLFRRLAIGVGVAGWVSVMLSVWFLGGLAIFCIGVIGIYLSKVFVETKNRPYTIVRRVHQIGNMDSAGDDSGTGVRSK